MKKIAALVCGLAWAGLALGGQAEIDQLRIKYRLPALAVLASIDGKTTQYVSGVRKWGDPTPALVTDKWHLGSDTKAMTATLVALEIERNRLTWDTDLVAIFPELASSMREEFKHVTVGMLLAHRSGLGRDMFHLQGGALWRQMRDPNLHPVEARKIALREVLSLPASSAPGSKFEYSNWNYVFAGAILERISGQPWETLISRELFGPLHMDSCGFGSQADPAAKPPDQPWPHRPSLFNDPVFVVPGFDGDNPPMIGPAGRVHCSLEDWAKFAGEHMIEFLGEPARVLKGPSFAKLHEAYPGQDYTYGGWGRVSRPWAGGPALSHAGSNTMNFSVVWIAPLKRAIFLSATNVGGDDAAKATDQAVASMIRELLPP